jgi:hypothetical protein
MANDELWPLTSGLQTEQVAAQVEQHRQELAREGMSWGLNRARIIERLRLRIQRDEAYLGFRERKGQHTLTDDAIASDLRVFALAIAYLERRIREDPMS